MASRVLRDGLLDSEAVAQLSDGAFRLYVHLLLTADDYGLVELGYGPIKRSAPLLAWSREGVQGMLAEITGAALVLPYEVDGKAFGALAKWRSTVNSVKPKHPTPPFGMGHVLMPSKFKDQRTREAAKKYLSHINELASDSAAPGSHEGVTSAALVPLRGKGEGVRGKGKNTTSSAPPPEFEEFWKAYPRKEAKPRALKAWKAQRLNGEQLPSILQAIKGIDSRDPKFIPMPATWLNDRRWEDMTGSADEAWRSQMKIAN